MRFATDHYRTLEIRIKKELRFGKQCFGRLPITGTSISRTARHCPLLPGNSLYTQALGHLSPVDRPTSYERTEGYVCATAALEAQDASGFLCIPTLLQAFPKSQRICPLRGITDPGVGITRMEDRTVEPNFTEGKFE